MDRICGKSGGSSLLVENRLLGYLLIAGAKFSNDHPFLEIEAKATVTDGRKLLQLYQASSDKAITIFWRSRISKGSDWLPIIVGA